MIKKDKTIISHQEKICTSLPSQALGLMFHRKQNLIMAFPKERKISLHNFCVFYPLEILILDKNKQVIEINHNFRPFTFWTAKQKGKYLIELGLEESKGKAKVKEILNIVES